MQMSYIWSHDQYKIGVLCENKQILGKYEQEHYEAI